MDSEEQEVSVGDLRGEECKVSVKKEENPVSPDAQAGALHYADPLSGVQNKVQLLRQQEDEGYKSYVGSSGTVFRVYPGERGDNLDEGKQNKKFLRV
jgi:hypothetical protein